MASFMEKINRLLPFATPGTPVIQDLVHLASICLLLYYAPQIQEWWQNKKRGNVHGEAIAEPAPEQQNQEPEHEEADQPEGELEQEAFEQEADIQDDGPNNDDFRAFQQQQQNQNAPAAGPANPPDITNQRNVGAKKAKSLARKDQRRAYHEFQRAQGEAQRAQDAEGAAEREAAQAAERERRKAAAAKLEAKKAKEREAKKEQERRDREEEIARRELAVQIVKKSLEERRKSNLFEVAQQVGGEADEVWVEKLLNASGILGTSNSDGTLTFVTSVGWVVRVTRDDMLKVYELADQKGLGDENGRIEYDTIGKLLEATMK